MLQDSPAVSPLGAPPDFEPTVGGDRPCEWFPRGDEQQVPPRAALETEERFPVGWGDRLVAELEFSRRLPEQQLENLDNRTVGREI